MDLILLNQQQRNFSALNGFYTPEVLGTLLLPGNQNLGYVRSLQYLSNNPLPPKEATKLKKQSSKVRSFRIDDILEDNPDTPLNALEELTCREAFGKSGSEFSALLGQKVTTKKKRKSRTAFTAHQLNELEKRFSYQKYLTPSDRDVIADTLGLTSTQVITWFQNRRAKLKRDVEDLKNHNKTITQIPEANLEIKTETDSEILKNSENQKRKRKLQTTEPIGDSHKKSRSK